MKTAIKLLGIFSILCVSSLSANKIVGILQPSAITTIKSQIAGEIKSIKYDISSSVKNNSTIVKINKIDYELEYSLALENSKLSSSNYELAKIDYARFSKLYEKKSITAQSFDLSKNKYQNAISTKSISKINLKQIKRKIEKTSIKAPYSGVISHKYIEIGDYVNVGDNVLEFINIKKLKAVFYILQHDYADYKKNQNLELIIPTLKNKKVKGKVLLISPSIVGTNPGYKMEILVDNSLNELKAGFNVELIIDENVKKD